MSKPSNKTLAVLIEHKEYSVRASRVGSGPLVNLWVGEHGNGGRGIILDVDQATELVEGLNDLLDEIEGLTSNRG